MPATYLLQDSAVLALRNIAARPDRALDFQPYFKLELDPVPRAVHESWDYCDMTGRYVDVLALIRQVTGLSAPEEERGLQRFLLKMQDPQDGLFYNKQEGESPHLADMFCQSRTLIGLCTWHMDTGDPEPLEALRRQVRGLMAVAERRDGYLLYPRNRYSHGQWLEGGLFYDAKDLWTVRPGYGGTQLEGIMKYFELTRDGEALRFVDGYLKYFLEAAQVVKEDGSYTGHLHSQGIVPTMIGAAMYAEATADKALLGLCGRFLRFTLGHCSRFGWVPDGIGWPTCETCALGDVVHLAVRLSRLGEGDYWHDVERIGRNQLLENQFRDPVRALAGRPASPLVEAIIRGSFASWAKPNDLLGAQDIEGCCTGGGVRALYHILANTAAVEADGTLAVRMHFSVDTEAALVESGLPYRGIVRVRPRKAGGLRLHRPEGVSDGGIMVRLGGKPVAARLDPGWVHLPGLPAGAVVEMAWDPPHTKGGETVAGAEYTATWKGNSVVALEPEGGLYPIYGRSAWLADDPPEPVQTWPVQGTRIRW